MKTIKSILSIICVLTFINVNSQNVSQKQKQKQKQKERQENKVKLFTTQEFSNMHLWVYNQSLEMRLSKEVDNEYGSIMSMYTSRISRLDDKDKDFTHTEIIEQLNILIIKLNTSIQPILMHQQYTKHLEIINVIKRSIVNKLNLKQLEA
jgi:hypothetical protein